MSTSEHERRVPARIARNYLLVSLGCAVFSLIYESFSHGVFSVFMVFLFLFPLLLGAAPFFLLSRMAVVPPASARGAYHAGLATLSAGSCLAGILEIYGTTSSYLPAYWIAGGILMLVGIGQALLPPRRHRAD